METLTKNRYPTQKVLSNHEYPSAYKGFLAIDKQIKQLAQCLKLDSQDALTFAKKIKQRKLPLNAEGFIAIPWWEAFAPTYSKAVQLLCSLIEQTRPFYYEKFRLKEFPEKYFCLNEYSKEALDKIKAQQSSDILILPAQAGLQHKGESILYARDEFLLSKDGEFGGDIIMGLTIILNHPERISEFDELEMDFPGVEYSFDGCDTSSGVLSLSYYGNREVGFVYGHQNDPVAGFGSISGFLLK